MAVVSLSGCEPAAERSPEPVGETTSGYAFTNVNVVSMTSDRVDADQTVVSRTAASRQSVPPEALRFHRTHGSSTAPASTSLRAWRTCTRTP